MSEARKSTARLFGYDGESGDPVIMRNQDGVESLQIVQAVVDGEPLTKEFVSIKEREGDPDLYDVETIYDPARDGPAMVNSPSFKSGWDRTFGRNQSN